jgi:hypothetical protein
LRRHGSLGAEAEAGPEVGNLAAGAGEPGRGEVLRAVRGTRGAGAAENPESGPSRVDGERRYRHTTDTQVITASS